MGSMHTMGVEGDVRIEWDPKKPAEVEHARHVFEDLIDKRDTRGQKMYNAYAIASRGKRGEQVAHFDPNAEKIILAAQMEGGR
jgi:hypothetical protein